MEKIRLPSFANAQNLKVRPDPPNAAQAGPPQIPRTTSLMELAEMVVRGEIELSRQQVRMLIELLPYHLPKLSAIAHGSLQGEDFSGKLDKAVTRTTKAVNGKVLQIEGQIGVAPDGEGSD
jgi:hypothetical protein